MALQTQRRAARRDFLGSNFYSVSVQTRGPSDAVAQLEKTLLCEHLSGIGPIPFAVGIHNAKFGWKRGQTNLELPDLTVVDYLLELSKRHPEVQLRIQVSPTNRSSRGDTVSHVASVTVLQNGQELRKTRNEQPDDLTGSWILDPTYDLWSEQRERGGSRSSVIPLQAAATEAPDTD